VKRLFRLSFLGVLLVTVGCEADDNTLDYDYSLYEIHQRHLFDDQGMAPIASSDVTFRRAAISWEAPTSTHLEGRLGLEDGTWTSWRPVTPGWSEGTRHTAHLDAPENLRAQHFQLRLAHGVAPTHLMADALPRLGEPEADRESPRYHDISSQTFGLGEADFPGLHLRAEWGARDPTCTYTTHTPSKITIHHTAGVAATTATAPATLRQIQSGHIDDREWCDIGYHYLVDSQGGVWQGRPRTVVGAHTSGYNTNYVGICLMGHFNDNQPPAAQMSAAAAVVEWLHQTHGIPKTSTYVKGHRDYGATDCPGHLLYGRLSEILSAPTSCIPTSTTEICGDGIDNDCKNGIDDGCTSPPPPHRNLRRWHRQRLQKRYRRWLHLATSTSHLQPHRPRDLRWHRQRLQEWRR